jgi:transposase
MVGIGEFRALAKDYLTRRGLADHRAQQEGIAESESAPRRIEIPTKRKAVAAWLDERYPDGIPAGTTAKHIARQFEAETGVRVDAKTVGRALGRP